MILSKNVYKILYIVFIYTIWYWMILKDIFLSSAKQFIWVYLSTNKTTIYSIGSPRSLPVGKILILVLVLLFFLFWLLSGSILDGQKEITCFRKWLPIEWSQRNDTDSNWKQRSARKIRSPTTVPPFLFQQPWFALRLKNDYSWLVAQDFQWHHLLDHNFQRTPQHPVPLFHQ